MQPRLCRSLAGMLIITTLLTNSCVVPTDQEMLAALSYGVLVPDRTCEDLREAFNVEHLPLVTNPGELGLEYEEDFIPNSFGQALRLWYIPAEADRGTIIFSHGSQGSAPCFLYITTLLHNHGWSVVMYEYQGFGNSTGQPDLASLIPDLSAVLSWTLGRVKHEQVTLLSMSLGSIPSVAIAVNYPDMVNAVALDSPVALGEEFARFDLLTTQRLRLVVEQYLPDLISENLIRDLHQPLLIFVGEDDIVTPPESAELLYNLSAGPAELVRFSDSDHAFALFRNTDIYMDRLEGFLTDVWENTPLESPD